MPTLRSLCCLSTEPKLAGWYKGVYSTLIPSLAWKSFQSPAVKVTPLSQVTLLGMPLLATQWRAKASRHVLALASRRGTASNQLVALSMMVKRWV